MRERPILFQGAMVRALLAETKTQTRRSVSPQPSQSFIPDGPTRNYSRTLVDLKTGEQYPDPVVRFGVTDENEDYPCKFGRPGDRLWVKECFSSHGAFGAHGLITYRADIADGKEPHGLHWRPSIFMPRTASRLLLEITAVRVERLNVITEADAKAEGVEPMQENHTAAAVASIFGAKEFAAHKSAYATLWEQINGRGSWALNPWVWVIEFRRVAPAR